MLINILYPETKFLATLPMKTRLSARAHLMEFRPASGVHNSEICVVIQQHINASLWRGDCHVTRNADIQRRQTTLVLVVCRGTQIQQRLQVTQHEVNVTRQNANKRTSVKIFGTQFIPLPKKWNSNAKPRRKFASRYIIIVILFAHSNCIYNDRKRQNKNIKIQQSTYIGG